MTGSGIDWEAVRRRMAEAEAALAGQEGDGTLDALFRRRARRLARPRSEPVAEAVRPVLGFHLGAERYALPLSDLAEVAPLRRYTRVPGWPPALAGVVNRRGTLVPLLNLHALMRLPEDGGEGGYVLFLRARRAVGVRVEALDRVHSAPAGAGGARSEYGPLVEAVTGDGLILLDGRKILALDVLQGASRAADTR